MTKKILHWGHKKFIPEHYQMCTKTVMDNIADPNITFDKDGVSNYWHEYKEAEKKYVYKNDAGEQELKKALNLLKTKGKGLKYDCILGVSGGVDSTYLAYFLKELNIRVLLVHFDYGWNSELAVKNIENIVLKTGFDLETVVMDWQEFKDLQRSYFKASVLDLDIPADHMIFGALNRIALKTNVKYIISGHNIVTEYILPKTWYYKKFDLTNLKNIHKAFGTIPLKKLQSLGYIQSYYYTSYKGIQMMNILNFIDYNKAKVKEIITKELDWIDYGGKHYESIFTRFYQGYILPNKFGIDKRKAHLSTLICSRQITKEIALEELNTPPIPADLAREDKAYVAKKLGFTDKEFENILTLKNVPHEFFGSDEKKKRRLQNFVKLIKPLISVFFRRND